jgi:Ran GTPase-activating protein (RanGAP) involved in mRNA processing and transport
MDEHDPSLALEPLEPAFVYEDVCRSMGTAPVSSILSSLAASPPGVLDARGSAAAGARVTDADCDALGETVAAVRLAALFASGNEIGDAGAAALVAGGRAASLQTLDLASNAIGPAGAAALADALAAGAPALLELVLDGNALGEAGGASVAALIEAHGALASVRLARCELGTSALIALAGALAKTTSLRLLDLSEPRTFSRNEETMSHIAGGLRANASLERLVLRKHAHASDTAVERLADAVLDNATLRELDLSANRLGPPSGATLAKALADGALLTVLQLSACRLADGGAVALADVLARGACGLRVLDLRSNDIGDAGIAALAAALASPACPLEQLLVWGNPGLRSAGAGATAWGDALETGAVRAATDVRAYVVDGAIHCAREDL